jgi:hypothetical protein
MSVPFAAARMVAIGTKRTWACALQMSAIGGKADIAGPASIQPRLIGRHALRKLL